LRDEGRDDEAWDAFAEEIARGEGPRVSWALWEQHCLGREEAQPALELALIQRHDEVRDPALAEIVAYCLVAQAERCGEAGDVAEQWRWLEDLAERFGARAAQPMFDAAVALGSVTAYERVIERFAQSAPLVAARALLNKGQLLGPEPGLDCYDEALVLLAGAEPEDGVRLLRAKGDALGRLDRSAEALVVFESAIAVPLPIDARMANAVGARLGAVDMLRRLGRADEIEAMVSGMGEALGDVMPVSRAPFAEPVEEELAALLAQVLAGPGWGLIGQGLAGARDGLAEYAVDLYRRTAPWVATDMENWDRPALGAALVVRNFADAYAMLSLELTPRERALLPLPGDEGAAAAIHAAGLDEWAAELGHPLTIGGRVEPQPRIYPTTGTLPDALTAALWRYELLCTLRDSARGRAALADADLRVSAVWQIVEARCWAAIAGGESEALTAGIMLGIGEAWALAALDATACDEPLVPSREQLRDLLDAL
jgi:hypothetical protein